MRTTVRTAMRGTVFGLCVLTVCATAAGQGVQRPERPIPPLQFGTTGSFSGFQFQQPSFDAATGAQISFEGIQFPGFGSDYDVTRQSEGPSFVPRNATRPFNGRFAPSRFPATRRPVRYWRMDRGDPFQAAAGRFPMPASRVSVARYRQPFGVLSADDERPSRPAFARTSPAHRIATQADVRSGRRRPFFD